MSKNRTYTNEQFIEAVRTSTSVRQVLQKLNLAAAGGGYYVFHKLVKQLSLDTSHFCGQAHNKGKIMGPKRELDEYLSNKRPIQSYKLKLRLLADGIFQPICSNCNLKDWLNNPIPLELDHIDGNHMNNSLDNLRLLCPNCHALTDNYRGKNKK